MTDHSNNGIQPGTIPSPAPQQRDWQVPPQAQVQDPRHQPVPEPQHFEPVIAQPEPRQEFLKNQKKRSRTLKLMQLLMSLTFFAAIGMAGFVMFTRLQVDEPGPLTQAIEFEVGKGQGLSAIANNLKKRRVIRNSSLFKLNPATIKVATKLKAGKYKIPAKASIQQVLDILVRGRAIFYKVTIPEGFTSQQAVARLNQHPQLSGTITTIPAEGSLMPNTYQFDAGDQRSGVLAKMSKKQQEFLAKNWTSRQKDLPFKTMQEALILASIVEKETGISSERKRVAGVFVNRLKKGIKLQSDPTIIYGLVGGQGKLGHPLRRSELNKKTSYNTYQIAGLPPTPIANPGPKAIEAVLHPADTKDLYFVADGTGGHAFAPTLKQHNNNVRKWRKIEAKLRAKKKRKEAEQARLAALEQNLKTSAKEMEKVTPGLTVTTQTPTQAKNISGWGNNIPLPTRKPR